MICDASLRKTVSQVLAGSLLAAALCAPALAMDDDSRRVKRAPKPAYPEMARRMSVHGSVKVEVVVSPAGSIVKTKVIGGHPLLVDSVLQTLKDWQYEPSPHETTSTVVFNFTDSD